MIYIIPFFHQAPFLRETLMSLRRQTDRNFSVVILDDSINPTETEKACAITQEFQDLGARYLRNSRNLGLAGNWNQAIEVAVRERHDYLVILHADDRLLPDYTIRIRQEWLRSPAAEAIFVKTRIIDENGRYRFSLPDFIKECIRPRGKRIELRGVSGVGKLIRGDFVFCPTICYRVACIKERRFDQARKQVLDFDWIVRSLLQGGLWIGLYDEPLFEYRRHSLNTTQQQSEDFSRYLEEIEFYRELSRVLDAHGEKILSRRASWMWIVRLNLGFEALKALVRLRWARCSRCIRLMFSVA
jgi:glycosyltransferase involved in cell wall biosynthesis